MGRGREGRDFKVFRVVKDFRDLRVIKAVATIGACRGRDYSLTYFWAILRMLSASRR